MEPLNLIWIIFKYFTSEKKMAYNIIGMVLLKNMTCILVGNIQKNTLSGHILFYQD